MKRWVTVGIALVAGALTLKTMEWAQEGPRFGRGIDEGGMNRRGSFPASGRLLALLESDRVRTGLGLTDQQVDRLRQIVVEGEKVSIKARSEMAVRGIELREMLRADNPDRATVLKKVDELSALRAAMAKQHVEELLAAKSVLTPEQQKKIRTFVQSRMSGEMMRRRWGGRPPGGPEEPGGRPAGPPTPPRRPEGEPRE